MKAQVQDQIVFNSKSSNKPTLVGFYSAIVLTALTIITFGLALTAIPISGANAPGEGLQYPYLDTLSQIPKDYIWIFSANFLILAYVVLMISIHSSTNSEKQIFSQISVAFAIISAVILLSNYYIQLSVIPVSLTNNEIEGITLITQYNPHGIFIALEELGYIMMSLSFLFAAPCFANKSSLESAIKWIFIISFVLTVLSMVGISIQFGIERLDRFEVLVISINWLVLIINGILLSTFFRRKLKTI